MEINILDAANLVGGKILGNSDIILNGVAKIENAREGDLTFLYLSSYEKYLQTTNATAVLVKPDTEKKRDDITYILVEDPKGAFQQILMEYFNYDISVTGIDETAHVGQNSQIGKNVVLGKNVVIGNNCSIGDNTKILHNTVILDNSTIGSNCLIYPNVTIRENILIGNQVIIHSNTVIGSDGFGYVPDKNGVYKKVPQIGNVVIEDDVELGSNVSIDRAALDSTVIKKGTKIDNLVQIAHNVEIGENTVISAQTGVSGSTKIGKSCILAGQVGTVGHIEITDGVIIGAQSGVSKSIKKPGKYFGYPAKEMGVSLRLESHIRNLPKYSERIAKLEKKIGELETLLENNQENNS
ncbi:MAG: UDP-3-O-(3-hydroxymyristoyl)glucosamine N-acyltransferase [Ignavibacteria bacterium]|jgi:UDP-3-O-[3-hydroxymyristoyl] glucosamine N-acyltransferase